MTGTKQSDIVKKRGWPKGRALSAEHRAARL